MRPLLPCLLMPEYPLEALFILIPLSILALGAAVVFFFRMSADGQFDDDQGPAWQVVLDDDKPQGGSQNHPQGGPESHEQASPTSRKLSHDLLD